MPARRRLCGYEHVLRPRAESTSRCSARPSARTCAAPSSGSPSARRSSSASRTTARPTASCGSRSIVPRAACSPAACGKGDRVGIWSPNRFEWVVVQFATARVGAILVNINPAYKAAELEYALGKSGVSLLVTGPRLPRRRLRRDARRGPPRCPDLRETVVLDDDWEAFLAAGDAVGDGELAAARGDACSSTTRSTSSTPRARPAFPRARRSRTTTSSTTRYFTAPRAGLHRARPRVRPGAVLPLLRHGAGQPRLHHATARAWSCPARRSTPAPCWRRSQAERCTSLYGVPTMFIAELEHPRFDAVRPAPPCAPGIMAGAPCPVEVMRQVATRMHMEEVDDLLRHDRDLAGLDADGARTTRSRSASRPSAASHPHVEIKIVDPATGAIVPRGDAGRASARAATA